MECGLARTPQESDPAWDALAQLIQSMNLSTGRIPAPEEVLPSEEGPEADTNDEGEGFQRFIDLLKQLQTLQAAGSFEAGDSLTRLDETPTPMPAGAGQEGTYPGNWLKQLLSRLRVFEGLAPAQTGETAAQLGEILTQNPVDASRQGALLSELLTRLQQELRTSQGLAPAESGGMAGKIATQDPSGAPREGALLNDSLKALLDQLRASEGAGAAETGEVLAQLRELLAQAPETGEGQSASALSGRMHQWLARANEALPGIPWGRLAQLIAGQGGAAESSAPATLSGENGQQPVESGSPAHIPLELKGLLREALGRGNPGEAGRSFADARAQESRPISAERSPAMAAESSRLTAGPGIPATWHPQVDGASPTTVREAPRVEAMPLPNETGRTPATEAPATPANAVEAGSDDGLSAAILRDVRAASAPGPAAEKSVGAEAALKQREADGAAAKGNVVEQIVQRAVVHLKNDRGEARIDLKPEFLGHVRMQIVTEHQQVTVRIMTELPMVRDLIEQNLAQLKSDLQQQGLQVERVEVSVANDPRRDAGRQHRAGGRRNGRRPDGAGSSAVGAVETRVQELARYWGQGGRNTINMFV